MKYFKQTLLGLTAGLLVSVANAGNGSGGGGVVLGNQVNPWFLSNTPVVSYCIQIDARFSTLSHVRVEELVAESLAFWKKLFDREHTEVGSNLQVGTKAYLYSPVCTSSTDLVFQMGFLTEAQKKEIPAHGQLMGLAYRTHYDPADLRGKGFIYIAAEQDANRPRPTGMHDFPWSAKDGLALKWALVHEVGHIYGLQDNHYAEETQIMSASFVENVASQIWIDFGVADSAGFGENVLSCEAGHWGTTSLELSNPVSKESQQILGIGNESLSFRLIGKGRSVELHEETQGGLKLAGTLHYQPAYSSKMSNIEMVPMIRMWVDDKQRVITDWDETYYNRYTPVYYGVAGLVVENARYVTSDGLSTPVFVKVGSGCFPTMGTASTNEITFDLLTPVSGSKSKK